MIRSALVSFLLCGALAAQSTSPSPTAKTPAPTPSASATKSAGTPYQNRPSHLPHRADMYYQGMWGVDSLTVKYAESGEIIRFSYRVVDAEKAKTLNDKKLEPALIDPEAHVKLVVPTLEKIGSLRQSSTPEAGKIYWMAFSNTGRPVRKGHRVDVVIGNFRAQGLIVN